eukprot:g2471.t1
MSAAVATSAQFELGESSYQNYHRNHSLNSATSRDSNEDSEEFLDKMDDSFGEISDASLVQQNTPSSNGKKLRKDKLAFVLGVAHFWICAYWLGSFPSTFYKLYTLEAFVLFPLRWKSFKKMKMHYYMFDFCYGANLLLLVYLWLFPNSSYLFKVLFAFNSGPLAWAIVLFKNSLVYHSLDEMTSVFMHWSPMLVSWSLRWYPQSSPVSYQVSPVASLIKSGINDMMLWPMIPYLSWAALYYLKIFVVSSKKIRDRGYHTLYKYMTEDSNFRILRSVVFKFSAKWQPVVYMCIHLLLVWMSLITTVIWWNSFWAHSTWVTIATLTSAWNGAAHYFQ